MRKLIIALQGGVVKGVYSDCKEMIKVETIDFDNMDAGQSLTYNSLIEDVAKGVMFQND